MKNITSLFAFLAVILLGACHSEDELASVEQDVSARLIAEESPMESSASVLFEKTLVDGLLSPVGVELVPRLGGLVVAEAGTGNDDGQISLYRGGQTIVLADGFSSVVRPDGNIEGTTHFAVNGGSLWIVNGVAGQLYRLDLQQIRADQLPIAAKDLPAQDIRSFIFNEGFTDSNIYNITFDEQGNAYIADSGANVVVKRSEDGSLSIFTVIPNITNPAPIGEPTVEPVPTGITYDGEHFFVSAFGGFPFAPGSSGIYKIDQSGEIVEFQEGYTTLIELEFNKFRPRSLFALQLGVLGETGFEPGSGALVQATSEGPVTLVDGLTFPNGLEVLSGKSRAKAFVTSIAEGTLTVYLIDTSSV